ncbi:MAG TPA: two-component regulator propeller domain-containing protein [Cyclobacteriaceae bacterium]|jgi:ligand-binding sensor domain-containing protein/two-component sensor histidine kinase|nr:two-component regulator propeller domain-containing protein [Cyclobacteriaceae bacterium]
MSLRFGFLCACLFAPSLIIDLRSQPIYHFQRIDVDRGLHSNYVTTIAQDADGFMWIGTTSGVQRFDMNEFVERPGSNAFTRVFIDRSGRKWFSNNTTVGIYNDSADNVQPLFLKDSSAYVSRFQNWITQDNDGTIWVSLTWADKRGYAYYDEKEGYLVPHDVVLPFHADIPRRDFSDVQGLGKNLLLGTGGGLFYYNKTKNRVYGPRDAGYPLTKFSDAQEPIFSLHSNGQNEIFLITWGPKKGHPYFYIMDTTGVVSDSYPVGEVRSVTVDNSNNIWLAGERLWKIDHQTRQIEDVQLPADIRMVNGIIKDREGNLWLATYHGVLVFNPNEQVTDWNQQNENGKTQAVETLCLTRTHDGVVVAGTWGGEGIYFYDKMLKPLPGIDHFTRKDFAHLKQIPVWSILESSDNSLWIGGHDGHLCRINRAAKKIEHFNSATFHRKTIRDICEDPLQNIWISTHQGRVFRRDAHTGSFSEINFKNDDTNLVFFKTDGTFLWLAYGRSIIKLDPKTMKWEEFEYNSQHQQTSALPSFIKIINIDANQITINAFDGLAFFNRNTKTFTFKKFFSPIVNCEYVGSKYLVAFEDGVLAEYSNDAFKFLQKGNSFNINSSQKLADNQYAFGNESGFTIVQYPLAMHAPDYIYPLRITSVYAQNEQKKLNEVLSKGLTLEHNQNYFVVTFSAVQFQEKDNIGYYYRINKSSEFINHGRNRNISFAELPPGKHELELYYSLAGVNSPVVSFKIEIIPPFWKTSWFLLLCVAVAASLVVFIYRIQLGKVLALVRVREKLSRDLHDEMGSNLSTINILANIVKGRLQNDSVAEKEIQIIDKISGLSSQAISAMDEIVWSLNTNSDSMEEIIKRMRVIGSHLEDLNINFMFEVEGNPNIIRIDPERRNHFYLIYKEIITNIKKHSHCRNVRGTLRLNDEFMELEIADDGIGFDHTKDQGGNGLRNIRNRSEKIRGQLVLKTQPGYGTTTTIRIQNK